MANTKRYFTDQPGITFPRWLATLGLRDESWKNDAAARAHFDRPDGFIVCVWVDYERPSDREIPGRSRYTVQLMEDDEDCEGYTVYDGDDWRKARAAVVALKSFKLPTLDALAAQFSKNIRAALTPGQLAVVIYRNNPVRRPYGTCATGDFIDSNVCMIAALAATMGIDQEHLPLNSARVHALSEAAWDNARESNFTTKGPQL